MKQNTKPLPNKKYFSKKFLILLTIFIILASMWLTKVGAIPNVFDIEFLCPNSTPDNNGNDDYYNSAHNIHDGARWALKPVIYLYPTTVQDVTVKIDYQGKLIATYPQYNSAKGWQVTARPDGQLINSDDNKAYSYLFWEGTQNKDVNWDLSHGFVVKGSDTREFLQEKLAMLGLTPREYNEFIVYWYPLMKDNAYNLITFVGKQYTDMAKLTITPTPDSILRVFMVYKPLANKISIKPQTIEPFQRKGFSVVEWGGSKLNP